MKRNVLVALVAAGVCAFAAPYAFAESGANGGGGHDAHAEMLHYTTIFLFLTAMFMAAQVGAIVSRVGLPSVLGELTAGILFFNVAQWIGFAGITALRNDPLVIFLAFLGVNLLLFKSGLEENLGKMIQVGARATLVAVVGMFFPFVGGFLLSKFVFFTDASLVVHMFVGATLVATSVGITTKIFNDLKYGGHTKSIVLGAAVMDDIFGLVVLAVVGVMADGGQVTAWLVGQTTAVALLFLAGAILLGYLTAQKIARVLSYIHAGIGMKMAMALGFCGIGAYAAVTLGGLEPIVGAFAAGLVLDALHFKHFAPSHQVTMIKGWMTHLSPEQEDLRKAMNKQIHHKEHGHVETLVEGIARFLVPLFFVHTGMGVDLGVFANPQLVGIALAISAVAIAGKLACGLVTGPGSDRWVAGWAMVARGEVGLVFANLALTKGVFTAEHFAVMVMVVVISTFVPPVILPSLIRKGEKGTVNDEDRTHAQDVPEPVTTHV